MRKTAACLFLTLCSLGTLFAGDSIIGQINQYRKSEGLSVLTGEAPLQRTAVDYCRELADKGVLSHVDPEGKRVLDRYRDRGGTSSSAGEILGTSPDRTALFSAWKNSPGHNAVMLNPAWTRIACSVEERDGQYIAVVLFSRSEIGSYSLVVKGSAVIADISPLKGGELSIPPYRRPGKDPVHISFEKSRLPVILVINGGTDYIYIGDDFFK